MPDAAAPALKDWFDKNRYRAIAKELRAVYPQADEKRFLAIALPGLEDLTLLQRLRRMSESLRSVLPDDFRKALTVLRKLAPRIRHNFVSLVLPDYVALYGLDHFDVSMEALRFFTSFGSSEFAVRHFLKADMPRALAIMEQWSLDENEHTRRLASEGSRPRLPWSFRLDALIADPTPTKRILQYLQSDPSLYVRKSVANHLNDITKDHPDWAMDWLERWPLENRECAWIVKRALRTLIKAGNPRALTIIGAGAKPDVEAIAFSASPKKLHLGERLTLHLAFHSASKKPQRLVIDYIIHYVKKSGASSGKVFKWKELTLQPGEGVKITRTQTIRDFTTRTHHAGRHIVEVAINGVRLGSDTFLLMK